MSVTEIKFITEKDHFHIKNFRKYHQLNILTLKSEKENTANGKLDPPLARTEYLKEQQVKFSSK